MKQAAVADMTSGPIFRKIVAFALPVMLSGILQQLYNAADVIVIGQLVGSSALAAVGATGSLINMVINLFVGLSIGTSIHVANAVGAQNRERTSLLVHASVAISLLCGVIVTVIGLFGSRTFLTWMDTPSDIIDMSVLYMQIYFCGSLFSMFFNFGAAILRAAGNSRSPFVYLAVSGVANVVLNYIFVAFFHMGVAGVATATVVSQAISAFLVLGNLLRLRDACQLFPSRIRLYPRQSLDVFLTGLPAGLQSVIFALSNTIIQSAVNSFDDTITIAGNTAAGNLEGFVYTAMNAFHVSTVTIVGQNVGAGRYERIHRVLFESLLLVTGVGIALGLLVYTFGPALLSIYLPNEPEAIPAGMERATVVMLSYFLCGIMETLVGAIRGMGSTVPPMIVSVACVCGVRLGWIYTVFASYRSMTVLFLSYPLSWIAACLGHIVLYFIFRRRLIRHAAEHSAAAAQPVPAPQ